VDQWLATAELKHGRIFRAVSRHGSCWGRGISENVVWYVVRECAMRLGLEHIAPHDLRRYAEYRIMSNRNLSPQDASWLGIISGDSIRHNRGR
jgi:integrase